MSAKRKANANTTQISNNSTPISLEKDERNQECCSKYTFQLYRYEYPY
jgi:hypothetical protein